MIIKCKQLFSLSPSLALGRPIQGFVQFRTGSDYLPQHGHERRLGLLVRLLQEHDVCWHGCQHSRQKAAETDGSVRNSEPVRSVVAQHLGDDGGSLASRT